MSPTHTGKTGWQVVCLFLFVTHHFWQWCSILHPYFCAGICAWHVCTNTDTQTHLGICGTYGTSTGFGILRVFLFTSSGPLWNQGTSLTFSTSHYFIASLKHKICRNHVFTHRIKGFFFSPGALFFSTKNGLLSLCKPRRSTVSSQSPFQVHWLISLYN